MPGNPGAGGIGIVLRYKQHENIFPKGIFKTTNNRMELRAGIEALNSLKEPCHVTLYSDSQYMKMASHNGFTIGRKTIGKRARAKAVKNQDLWIALDQAIQTHNIDWQWVKGHSGHRENEICDELAKQGAEKPNL